MSIYSKTLYKVQGHPKLTSGDKSQNSGYFCEDQCGRRKGDINSKAI